MTPETTAFLEFVSGLSPVALEPAPIRERRSFLARTFDSGPPSVQATDTEMSGVPVRAFVPHERVGSGTIVYVHGGGWVAGDTTTHDGVCRWICAESGLEVISVDYQRAPESQYPGPVGETLTVLASVAQRLNAYDTFALAGDSSGAHIAFEAALDWQNRSPARPLSRLLLIQPACDSTLSSPSWERFGSGYFLSAGAMRWYWDCYLGTGGRSVLWEHTLESLPATHIITSSLDPSIDEAETLAAHLASAGVPTTSDRIDGVPHGCLTLAGAFPSVLPRLHEASRWLAGPTGN